MTTPEPADLELLADGAMKVRQAVEFSGLSRAELFNLMADGTLAWFKRDTGPHRFIVKRSLVAYLAALYRTSSSGSARRNG